MSETTPIKHEVTLEARRAANKWIVRAISGAVIYGALLFLPAGTLNWIWGWALWGVLLALMIVQPWLLLRYRPEVLVEREEKGLWHQGVKTWDKWITTLAGGLMPLPWIIAGLDVRFQWTTTWPLGYHLAGLLVTGLGYALFVGAMAYNPFFAQGVRLQTERGHVAVTSGPYRYVRHPGYAGAILTQLATPFLLGSPWALIPAGMSAVLFIIRTYLEDTMLLAELPGYKEYAQQTPRRLWPGVW